MLRRLTLTCLCLAALPVSAEIPSDVAEPPMAVWIWKTTTPGDNERVYFRREFQLPPDVLTATITVVCDDSQRLFVNGHDLGTTSEWRTARVYDVLSQLKPGGRNVIAVDGKNDQGSAGLVLRFSATFRDGKKLQVVSDANWLCSSEAVEGWQSLEFSAQNWSKAAMIAKLGAPPWGDVMPAEVVDSVANERYLLRK